jgi:hypothetical protein
MGADKNSSRGRLKLRQDELARSNPRNHTLCTSTFRLPKPRNHCKPRKLGVASANLHSWLSSHVVPARPWFWGSTKKPSTTSSCCSCHHAACTWPHWPPGPSNEGYLSSPHLEASPAMTFRACSSPAPTRVKPQPAPAILSQESVHTTLSISHHTRKRPSTGPRTTHGPQVATTLSHLKSTMVFKNQFSSTRLRSLTFNL